MKTTTYFNWIHLGLRLLAMAAFLFTSNSWASTTEARLYSDKVTYSGPDGKVAVTLSGLLSEQIEVSVQFGDKVIKVPKRFLFGAKNISEETVRLSVPTPNAKVPLWKQALDEGFYIYFEFGGTYEHGTEEKPVDVLKGLLIKFQKGQLSGVEMAVPAGDYKNQWVYHYRDAGIMHKEGKEEVGKYDSAKNTVRCPWSDGQ